MTTENLQTLKIHKLSQSQYERELAAGRIDENALYLTPDTNSGGGGGGLPTLELTEIPTAETVGEPGQHAVVTVDGIPTTAWMCLGTMTADSATKYVWKRVSVTNEANNFGEPIVFRSDAVWDATLYGLEVGDTITVAVVGGGGAGQNTSVDLMGDKYPDSWGTPSARGGAGGKHGNGFPKLSSISFDPYEPDDLAAPSEYYAYEFLGGNGGTAGVGYGAGGGGAGGAPCGVMHTHYDGYWGEDGEWYNEPFEHYGISTGAMAVGGRGGGCGECVIQTITLTSTQIPITIGLPSNDYETAAGESSFGSYVTARGCKSSTDNYGATGGFGEISKEIQYDSFSEDSNGDGGEAYTRYDLVALGGGGGGGAGGWQYNTNSITLSTYGNGSDGAMGKSATVNKNTYYHGGLGGTGGGGIAYTTTNQSRTSSSGTHQGAAGLTPAISVDANAGKGAVLIWF